MAALPRLLLDTPSLGYRAFFALPATIRSPDGRSVNAVRGYLDMCTRLLTDRPCSGLVSVFDVDWRPAFRVQAYPGYKAARRPDPPELEGQFEVIREVLEAAGMAMAGAGGYEADDVLATLAATATDDTPVDIVTGDRDLLQLVRDRAVRVLFTLRGVSDLGIFDEAGVRARYGIEAAQYADYAILRGDPSDGLPGIAGVGEKTALELLHRYGSLQALTEAAAAAGDPSPRVLRAVRNAAEYIAAMRVVVQLPTDLALTLTAPGPPDEARLQLLARRHGIEGPVERLQKVLTTPGR